MAKPKKSKQPTPGIFKKDLAKQGYYLQVETRKILCVAHAPHWVLYDGEGCEKGKIYISGKWWVPKPKLDSLILQEAEELTRIFADTIDKVYDHNRLAGNL